MRRFFYRKKKAEIWVGPELKCVIINSSRQNISVYGNRKREITLTEV